VQTFAVLTNPSIPVTKNIMPLTEAQEDVIVETCQKCSTLYCPFGKNVEKFRRPKVLIEIIFLKTKGSELAPKKDKIQ
jgi:hypothetical protein